MSRIEKILKEYVAFVELSHETRREIVCGWNSLGLGAKHGMQLEEILLVNHGDQNDTIVTVGRKMQSQLTVTSAYLNQGDQS